MPKLSRDVLDKLTEQAVRVAGRAMSLMVVTGVPFREEYESVETLVDQAERLRKELDLPAITDRQRLFGEVKKREPIGFDYVQ